MAETALRIRVQVGHTKKKTTKTTKRNETTAKYRFERLQQLKWKEKRNAKQPCRAAKRKKASRSVHKDDRPTCKSQAETEKQQQSAALLKFATTFRNADRKSRATNWITNSAY